MAQRIIHNLLPWRKEYLIAEDFIVDSVDPKILELFHDLSWFFIELRGPLFYEEREKGQQLKKYDHYRNKYPAGVLDIHEKGQGLEIVYDPIKTNPETIVTTLKGIGVMVSVAD